MLIRTFSILALLAGLTLAQNAPLGKGQILILIGAPGSGKSVQAKGLSKRYKIPAITLAELSAALGAHVERTLKAESGLASGEFVGDENAIGLVAGRVMSPDCANGFILDGFPVNATQAKYLESFVRDNKYPRPRVVVLEISDDVAKARMLKRKRVDDTPANIDKRLAAYRKEYKFLEDWYKPEHMVKVDGTGTPQQVQKAIEEGLTESFSQKGLKARPAAK